MSVRWAAAVLAAIVVAAVFGVLWRDARQDLDASATVAEERAQLAESLRLALNRAKAEARDETAEAFRRGAASVLDDSEYDRPWKVGGWYIVRVAGSSDNRRLTDRATLRPDGSETYYVQDGKVFALPRTGASGENPCSFRGLDIFDLSDITCDRAREILSLYLSTGDTVPPGDTTTLYPGYCEGDENRGGECWGEDEDTVFRLFAYAP
jgi:hypothetical protein